MPIPSLRIALLTLVGLTGACGSSASDRFADIDRDETLDELEAAAYQKMCSSFEDWVYDQYASSPVVQAVCMAVALESTETASACGEALEDCLDNPPPEATALLDDILAQASCAAVAIDRDGCASTVGRVQDCLDGLSAAIDRIQLTLTCAAAGQTLDPTWWQVELPSECVALQSEC